MGFSPWSCPPAVVDCCGLLLSISYTGGEQDRRVLYCSGPVLADQATHARPLGVVFFSEFLLPMASSQFPACICGRCCADFLAQVQCRRPLIVLAQDRELSTVSCPSQWIAVSSVISGDNRTVLLEVTVLTILSQKLKPFEKGPS